MPTGLVHNIETQRESNYSKLEFIAGDEIIETYIYQNGTITQPARSRENDIPLDTAIRTVKIQEIWKRALAKEFKPRTTARDRDDFEMEIKKDVSLNRIEGKFTARGKLVHELIYDSVTNTWSQFAHSENRMGWTGYIAFHNFYRSWVLECLDLKCPRREHFLQEE